MIRVRGRVMGTVNLLHEHGYYDAGHLDTVRLLAGLIAGASVFEAAGR